MVWDSEEGSRSAALAGRVLADWLGARETAKPSSRAVYQTEGAQGIEEPPGGVAGTVGGHFSQGSLVFAERSRFCPSNQSTWKGRAHGPRSFWRISQLFYPRTPNAPGQAHVSPSEICLPPLGTRWGVLRSGQGLPSVETRAGLTLGPTPGAATEGPGPSRAISPQLPSLSCSARRNPKSCCCCCTVLEGSFPSSTGPLSGQILTGPQILLQGRANSLGSDPAPRSCRAQAHHSRAGRGQPARDGGFLPKSRAGETVPSTGHGIRRGRGQGGATNRRAGRRHQS